jgi:hypothetical protein
VEEGGRFAREALAQIPGKGSGAGVVCGHQTAEGIEIEAQVVLTEAAEFAPVPTDSAGEVEKDGCPLLCVFCCGGGREGLGEAAGLVFGEALGGGDFDALGIAEELVGPGESVGGA